MTKLIEFEVSQSTFAELIEYWFLSMLERNISHNFNINSIKRIK
jgi:hypothetical protein